MTTKTIHIAEQLIQQLQPLIEQVSQYEYYKNLNSITQLQLFTGEHVFVVWDFMCLLKVLYGRIVSTKAPWLPPKDALSANLIASIIVEEEGDLTEDGEYASHFDMYLNAMRQMGANTQPIETFIALLSQGTPFHTALEQIPLREGTKAFLLSTHSFFELSTHEVAAAFVFGREGVIASMFTSILNQIKTSITADQRPKCSKLIFYLERHISLDDSEHFPKSLKMLSNLIKDDHKKYEETVRAAKNALKARIAFLSSLDNCLATAH